VKVYFPICGSLLGHWKFLVIGLAKPESCYRLRYTCIRVRLKPNLQVCKLLSELLAQVHDEQLKRFNSRFTHG